MTVAVIAALGCATPAHAVHVVRIASFPTSQLAVESARLNGDTIDDLAVASNCVVTALAGHGDGTYSPSASVTLAPCGGDRRAWLATGDVDGDGKQDVVVSVQQAQVWVLSGRGDGTFAPAVSYPTATGLPAYGVTVGDLNGDRRDDVAFVEDTLSLSSPSDIGVLVAQAGGGFAPAARYAADFRKATDLTTGHFDNDPFLDVAVGGEHCTGGCVNSVISFPGNGDGTFGQPHFAPTNLIPTGLLAAPLRGLARDDIAVTGNRVQSVLTDAEGALTPLAEHRDITGGRGDTGDLDGDGAPDLALAEPSLTARISLFLGDGAGDFDVEADLGFPSPSNFYDTQIVDADRDGWPDVVAAGAGEVDLIRNAPVAGLDPEALDFGTVPVGARSGPRTVTVYNGGVRPVQLAAARVDGPFAIASDGCGATTLAILGSCDITIELRPAAAGPAAGTLTVPSDDPDGPATAALAGVAQAVPQPVVRPVLQPLPDRVPPQLKATVVHRKLKDALRKGLAVTVRCSEACSLDATLALPPGQRKALRLRQTQVGHVTAKLGQAGSTTVTFKLSSALRKAAKRVKQLKLLLTVAATDLAGNRATTTPRITLRR